MCMYNILLRKDASVKDGGKEQLSFKHKHII